MHPLCLTQRFKHARVVITGALLALPLLVSAKPTPLMEAVYQGNTPLALQLIQAGADASIPDKNGVSALTHAQQRHFTDIVRLLENKSPK